MYMDAIIHYILINEGETFIQNILTRSSRRIYNPIRYPSNCTPREAPSTCLYENRRQHIKSLEMVVETSDINKFSYFYALNQFTKLTRPKPTRPDPARQWSFLTVYISDSIVDTEVKF